MTPDQPKPFEPFLDPATGKVPEKGVGHGVGSTSWRITNLVGTPYGPLNVRLTVETTAPVVVSRIERAAAAAGVVLERTGEGTPREVRKVRRGHRLGK